MRFQSPNRSPTAVSGLSDVRSEFVYSSGVLMHGAQGVLTLFGATRGQAIPKLGGTGIASTATHHANHDFHSTNLAEPSKTGSALGDIQIKSIALDVEQVVPQFIAASAGTLGTWGATAQELTEIASKCYFIFKLGTKEMQKAPFRCFPALGGVYGSTSNTTNNSLVSVAQNGTGIRAGRTLRSPIDVDRTDTIEAQIGIASSSTLAFRLESGTGGETMVTCLLDCGLKGDVR